MPANIISPWYALGETPSQLSIVSMRLLDLNEQWKPLIEIMGKFARLDQVNPIYFEITFRLVFMITEHRELSQVLAVKKAKRICPWNWSLLKKDHENAN